MHSSHCRPVDEYSVKDVSAIILVVQLIQLMT